MMRSQKKQLTLGLNEKPVDLPRGKPLIISASRRTDLPGFYPQECVDLIRQKVARFKTRYLYGVMFWSKQPLPFIHHSGLRNMVNEIKNPLLQLTVTGLGGSSLEPGIPSCERILNAIPELISVFKGDPARIRWRFDPILYQQNGIRIFTALAERMTAMGIKDCTISFPTYVSLKGSLDAQFNTAGIPKWEVAPQQQFLEELVEAAQRTNITLYSCAQPRISQMQPVIKPAACIDSKLLRKLHPDQLPLDLPKDYSQRRHCNCVQSEDIGSYSTHRCHGGCAYCYSKAGGSDAGA